MTKKELAIAFVKLTTPLPSEVAAYFSEPATPIPEELSPYETMEIEDRIERLVSSHERELILARPELSKLAESYYTLEELQALVTFLESPVGRKWLVPTKAMSDRITKVYFEVGQRAQEETDEPDSFE